MSSFMQMLRNPTCGQDHANKPEADPSHTPQVDPHTRASGVTPETVPDQMC